MIHWSTKLLGLPWVPGGRTEKEMDCWGLLMRVYKEQLGISLPEHKNIDATRVLEYSGAIRKGMEDWELLEKPEHLCGVALSRSKKIHHVGVYLENDGGLILHCHEESGVIIQTPREMAKLGWRKIEYYGYSH